MSGTKEGSKKLTGAIHGSRRRGTVRGDRTMVFVSGEELTILRAVAERSGLTASGAVRALIHLHASDTLHVEQKVEVQTNVSVVKK